MRTRRRIFVYLLAVLAAAAAWPQGHGSPSGTLTGTVLGQRQTDDGQALLLSVPAAVDGASVTSVRIGLARKAARQATARSLPPGWSLAVDKRALVLTGPAAAPGQKLAFSLGLEGPVDAQRVAVTLSGEDGELAAGEVPLVTWPEVGQPLDPNQAATFPPVVSLDGPVTFTGKPDLPPGSWTVGGYEVEEDENGTLTVYATPVWEPEISLKVSYKDLWAETLVDGTLEDVEVVPGGDPTDPPRLDDCSPKVLTGGTLCVCGYFPTWESRTSLTLNGIPLGFPKTSSDWILTFDLPDIPPGEFVVAGPESAGFPAGSSASGVHIAVSGDIDRERLLRGDSTPLRLWLEGTTEPTTLRLWNSTPGVVSLAGGEDQQVTTSGGSPNQVEETVHAVSVGDFVISYELAGHWCPCAEVIAEQAVTALGADTTVAATTTGGGSTTARPCARSTEACDRLRRLAETATRLARSARAEADRLEANRRWTESDADWLRETSRRTDDYIEVLRRQAGEWRELAANARASAERNRERDKTYPGTGWDYWAKSADQDAARRQANAERLEAEIARLEKDVSGDLERADQLEEAIRAADRAATAAEAEAAKARAAYEACLAKLRSECPASETGTILYEGPVTVTEAGEDPRDVDPSDPEAKICGPDVTDHVLRVLDRMIDDYNAATDAKKAEACENLTTLQRDSNGTMIAEYAWDIYALSPAIAPTGGAVEGEKYWYEGVSDICARPRYPCGPTVVFLGQCIHAQVVNYVQWGAMMRLCGDETTGDFMHWARATAGGLSNWEWKTAHYESQLRMSEMGSEYVGHRRSHDADRDFQREPEFWTPDKLRGMRQDMLEESLGSNVAGNADWAARDARRCAMICRLTSEQAKKIDKFTWGYNWLGLREDSPTQTGIVPRGNR